MYKRTAMIRTSVTGFVLMWSALAMGQSSNIEPIEAKMMAKSGELTGARKGTTAMNQDKAESGEAKQLKVQGDAAKRESQAAAKQEKAQKRDATTVQAKSGSGEAKQAKAQKGEAQGESQAAAKQEKAQKRDATTVQAKSGSGEAKQAKAQKGESQGAAKQEKVQNAGGSALREATRAMDNSRIRESKRDHSSAMERGAGARSGENCRSETAEHRQERRGGATGSAGAAKGAGAGAGSGAAKHGQS